jgi:ATP-dependent DNA helicase RecG
VTQTLTDKQHSDEAFEYQPVTVLKGVGPAVAEKLAKLEIYTIQDVLFHLPLRYEDRTRLTPIGALRFGQQAVIEGVIDHTEIKFGGRRTKGRSSRSLLCHISDNTGAIILRFFHFSKAQQERLKKGQRLRCFGEARRGPSSLEMAHPEYQFITEQADSSTLEKALTPVYPKTDGVHQTMLKKLSDQVITRVGEGGLREWLPQALVDQHGFPSLQQALLDVHRPPVDINPLDLDSHSSRAQQRLIFEELIAHQLSLLVARQKIRHEKARELDLPAASLEKFIERLPFALTGAQRRVIDEIYNDIRQEHPMLRLVQGDVGSGKTVVAAAAALPVLEAGLQIAIMAPTEILAEQHYENFSSWFTHRRCLMLSGRDKGSVRQQKLDMIRTGKVNIIIGTHALFQADVVFASLVLLVVDEQHRFGVHQRLALREKGYTDQQGGPAAGKPGAGGPDAGRQVPHQLIMTATPIPRSLAMTAYADLDYSVIDELPAGRKPVKTVVISTRRRQEVIDRIESACERGEQAYWVCTLVEESEVLQCQAAEATATQLASELKNVRVGLVHGRMKQAEKQQVVERFRDKQIDLLVATTVIEVGVDVPDASLMVIENAERLGLAQLHQLRGRVGRGSKASACVLLYQPPLSDNGKQRLHILRESNDGFVIAQKDLEIRGPGEVLGTRQTGLMQFRIADIVRDELWFGAVKQAAENILRHHPASVRPLVRRWLGKADRFSQV